MSFKSTRIIITFLIIGFTIQTPVEGLQCYVCEDCNEYEDFKELHICGELSIDGTTKPVTLPEIIGETTRRPTKKPTQKPTTKQPVVAGNSEEYIYDDSEEKRDENKRTESPTIKTRTATESTVTVTPNVVPETTMVTLERPSQSTLSDTESKTTSTTTSTTTSSSPKPKPVVLPDYDDYLEYEDPVPERRSYNSLIKISEPVCYMFKYHVNNTIITNRGCTTFINSNKYLTCQSLYNGAPMSSCRVCSTNGCNKFLSDDSDEDDHGIYINAAGAIGHFKMVLASIGALIVRVILAEKLTSSDHLLFNFRT